jgi:hypothetical protein
VTSRRSRSAPGNIQGRSARLSGAGRYKDAIRTKRIDEARRFGIHEIGDARRASVYREDVEFAPPDISAKLPSVGSSERWALLSRVAELRAQGLSHQKIGVALDPQVSATTVANLLKEIKRNEQ